MHVITRTAKPISPMSYRRAFLYSRQFGFFRVEPIGECLRKSLYDTYLLACCNMSIIVENAKKGTGRKIKTSNFYGFMLTSVYATSLRKNYLLFSKLVCTGNEIWQSIQRSDNNNKELFLKIFVSFFVNTYSKNQKICPTPMLEYTHRLGFSCVQTFLELYCSSIPDLMLDLYITKGN